MVAQAGLREKLRKLEALAEGAATLDERRAAEAAIDRVRARLEVAPGADTPVEQQFSFPDDNARRLFVALCRRYGYEPYRRACDTQMTVSIHAAPSVVEGTILRRFHGLDAELRAYLSEVSLKIIREEIHADVSEAWEIQEALPAPAPEPSAALPALPQRPASWLGWIKRLRSAGETLTVQRVGRRSIRRLG